MKAGHDGQLLHGQLLGGLLVTMATAALDLSAASEVLGSGEPAGGKDGMGLNTHVCVWSLWEQITTGSRVCSGETRGMFSGKEMRLCSSV